MVRFTILLFVLFVGAGPGRADLPRLFREKSFTCVTLAEAVNYYVSLGEQTGLKELESAALDRDKEPRNGIARHERIGWVCRVLFDPKDNEPLRGPMYGAHDLPEKTMPLKSWPLHPVASSGSTYFVLSEGYSLSGVAESTKAYLHYCRTNGKFRTVAIPQPTKVQAMKDLETLRQSPAWKAIKWKDSGPNFSYTMDEGGAWRFIKAQAETIPDK